MIDMVLKVLLVVEAREKESHADSTLLETIGNVTTRIIINER